MFAWIGKWLGLVEHEYDDIMSSFKTAIARLERYSSIKADVAAVKDAEARLADQLSLEAETAAAKATATALKLRDLLG